MIRLLVGFAIGPSASGFECGWGAALGMAIMFSPLVLDIQ